MSGRTQVSVGLLAENLQEDVDGNPRTSAWALVRGFIQSLTAWNLDMRPGCLMPSTGYCGLRGCVSCFWVLRRPGRESRALLRSLGRRDMALRPAL